MGTKRRKRGMGSIFKHGTSWWISFYHFGRQIRERIGPVGLITKGQAEQALKARMGEVVQGRFNLEKTKAPIQFNRLLREYLQWTETNHRAPQRDHAAAKVLLEYFDGMNLQDITAWHFEKFKADRKTKIKPGTLNRELSIVKRMFNLGIQWGLTSYNPLEGVKFLPKTKNIPRSLREWEFEKVYNAASPHFKPILLCAYMTGMRRGEITKLEWKDVDFEAGYIFVRETKNNEDRAVPMNEALKRALWELYKNKKSDRVFTTQRGEPYKYTDAFKRAWQTALRRSGIDKCRFHDLRHTFTSNLIVGQKLDLITVSELTGHKDLAMLKRYGHTREEYKKEAVNKLGSGLDLTGNASDKHIISTKGLRILK
jgi:integrase